MLMGDFLPCCDSAETFIAVCVHANNTFGFKLNTKGMSPRECLADIVQVEHMMAVKYAFFTRAVDAAPEKASEICLPSIADNRPHSCIPTPSLHGLF